MIRNFTRFAILALALVTASSPGARAADPYEIHVITELTGPVSFLGARQLEVLHSSRDTSTAPAGSTAGC